MMPFPSFPSSYAGGIDVATPLPLSPCPAEGKIINIRTASKVLKADTVVISDIHLGSQVCRAKELRKALKSWYPFKRLIILGDLFEDLNFSRLNKQHFGVIDDIRKLTNEKRNVTVDWLEGNHDEQAHDVIRRIVGANVHDELLLEYHNKNYLFMHGHQFDNFLYDHPIITTVAGNFYASVQKREGGKKSVSRWLKKKSKGWLKVCRRVEEKAILYASSRNADMILCGHTHYHDATDPVEGKIRYYNTGCWTDTPSTITTIGPEGLRKYTYD